MCTDVKEMLEGEEQERSAENWGGDWEIEGRGESEAESSTPPSHLERVDLEMIKQATLEAARLKFEEDMRRLQDQAPALKRLFTEAAFLKLEKSFSELSPNDSYVFYLIARGCHPSSFTASSARLLCNRIRATPSKDFLLEMSRWCRFQATRAPESIRNFCRNLSDFLTHLNENIKDLAAKKLKEAFQPALRCLAVGSYLLIYYLIATSFPRNFQLEDILGNVRRIASMTPRDVSESLRSDVREINNLIQGNQEEIENDTALAIIDALSQQILQRAADLESERAELEDLEQAREPTPIRGRSRSRTPPR